MKALLSTCPAQSLPGHPALALLPTSNHAALLAPVIIFYLKRSLFSHFTFFFSFASNVQAPPRRPPHPLGCPVPGDVRGTGIVPVAGGQGRAEGGEAGSGAKLNKANGVKAAATPAWGQHPPVSTLLATLRVPPAVFVPGQPRAQGREATAATQAVLASMPREHKSISIDY